jgi:hypothetical protein
MRLTFFSSGELCMAVTYREIGRTFTVRILCPALVAKMMNLRLGMSSISANTEKVSVIRLQCRSVVRNFPRGCPPAGKLVGPADHFSALSSPPAIFSPTGVPGHPFHTPWLRPCFSESTEDTGTPTFTDIPDICMSVSSVNH